LTPFANGSGLDARAKSSEEHARRRSPRLRAPSFRVHRDPPLSPGFRKKAEVRLWRRL